MITYPAASDPLESGFGDIAPGQWPVLLFAHANSYAECRRLDAYTTLHEHWASWGYVVVSVDASALCEENSRENLEGRRDDLLTTSNRVEAMARDRDSPLFGHIDTDSIVLAGHSRGATAALLAARSSPEIDGLIWMQGVDTAGYDLGHYTTRVPTIGIVAGRDRDIRFPRAEPTREQFAGPHAWTTLLGGIHAYTSDDIPPKQRDRPAIDREEQLSLVAELSTLLLAATVGLSDGTSVVPVDEAPGRIFGEPIRRLSENVLATWQPPADETIWLDDFSEDRSSHRLGGPVRVVPAEAGTHTYTWNPESEDPGRILGDSRSFVLRSTTSARLVYELRHEGRGLPIPQGTRLSILVKNLDASESSLQMQSDEGEQSWPLMPARPEMTERFQQIVIDLAPTRNLEVMELSIEVEGGEIMVDDLLLILPQ